MIFYSFKCKNKHKFEKRLYLKDYEAFKKGKKTIECPKCKNKEVKSYIAKGSGQFKSFKW